ncbi:hypothetical protein SAMN06265379_10793 [Saccharicrinis carchari]|uniref:Histidine kinase-, DNA gyrase B-, and HSP90-like ATPase n=1 Tax=Saccharicrinis carchari TaxID=1168039 RepID=A0A521E270_SACCC|nr:SiaB family protein kinase [Saccharicrinis carchari]SMO77401.1 hypothetical protein SAMN06265379_10793 [Saccharicrinis carchari]
MAFNIKQWYNEKLEGEILLNFNGNITPELITEALDTIEKSLNLKNEKFKVRKKVYNVFVECLQNLYHHVDVPPVDLDLGQHRNFGVIILSKDGPFYRISTGNFVNRDKISLIKDRIDQVNSLTDKEVRMLYLDIMGNGEFSDLGGGGLGMLDIVRKTGNKLEYYFYKYNDHHIFFSLDVYIS